MPAPATTSGSASAIVTTVTSRMTQRASRMPEEAITTGPPPSLAGAPISLDMSSTPNSRAFIAVSDTGARPSASKPSAMATGWPMNGGLFSGDRRFADLLVSRIGQAADLTTDAEGAGPAA